MFVPLKVMTDYSMMKSMITIPKLLEVLQKNHISVCGICDKNLFGVMEFYDTMTAYQIKPIIGLEVTLGKTPIYLYARDHAGYESLLQIQTIIEQREFSMLDLESMQSHLNVVLPFLYMDEFSKLNLVCQHLFLGCSSEYEKNNAMIVSSNTVYVPNLFSLTRQDTKYIRVLKSIDEGTSLSMIPEENLEKNAMEYYLGENLFDENTKKFCDSCNVTIDKTRNFIPKFDKEKDSNEYLVSLSKKGLAKRLNGNVTKNYADRLLHELDVIQKMGFADYFLIVYDYVKFAKKNGILVGAGRGSAVGSLVSYCLGITDVDPIPYHLLFERFLNPDRVTMPDIDIDFEEDRRDEVVSYVKQRYGEKCVANIMTFGTLKSKLVLRSVGKSLEIHGSVIDHFLEMIDAKLTLKENLQNQNVLYYVKNNQDIHKMYEISLKIEGLKKHISTHAAGVVISSVPLDEVIPIHYNGEDLLTGVTMNYLEELGLLKMDFLALRNLTIMKKVLDLIEENTGESLDIHKINLNDAKVLKLFTDANTIGIFQFESEGMKNFLRKLKPTKFLDLVSAIALYRPGPMENIDSYIRRKDGKEKVDYYHEDLKPILEETYGIIVYQEQIMQILVTMGGFKFSEADTIRRAMSKKKKEVIEKSKESFIEGALKKGYEKNLVEKVFALILKFADYGFNKSHSVSYALIGYQMAYLKSYYPIFFIANLLNMTISSVEKTKEYLALARRSGIEVLPVDINESGSSYKIKGNSLRVPFTIIKSLGEEAAKTIMEKRGEKPFTDFFDFVARTYGKSVTRKTIESLIDADAFRSFTTSHNTLKANMDSALNYAELASDLEEDYIMKPTLEEKPEESLEEKRKSEYNSFGFYISNHPSSKYVGQNIMKLEDIRKYYDKHVECVVLVERIKKIKTKNNEDMAFLTVSDETFSNGNFVLFSSVMKEVPEIKVGDFIRVKGRVSRRLDEYQVNINQIEFIEESSSYER